MPRNTRTPTNNGKKTANAGGASASIPAERSSTPAPGTPVRLPASPAGDNHVEATPPPAAEKAPPSTPPPLQRADPPRTSPDSQAVPPERELTDLCPRQLCRIPLFLKANSDPTKQVRDCRVFSSVGAVGSSEENLLSDCQ